MTQVREPREADAGQRPSRAEEPDPFHGIEERQRRINCSRMGSFGRAPRAPLRRGRRVEVDLGSARDREERIEGCRMAWEIIACRVARGSFASAPGEDARAAEALHA